MHDPRSEEFLQPYREAVARHGPSFEATLWGSPETQILRFDVMIQLVGPAGFDGGVIMDVGCGRGDLAARLLERGIEFASYLGLDALPEMIESARERKLPRSTFETADVVVDPDVLAAPRPDGPPDWVCVSGTLNTMDETNARGLIGAACDAAAQGVVFNFLSDRPHPRWAGRDLTPAHRFDTGRWLDWAMTRTSRVSFTQEYLDGHDATILMRHDGDADSS